MRIISSMFSVVSLICEEYAEMCLSQDRAFHYYGLNGEKKQRLYLVWTPEGAEFIKDSVNE